MSGDPADRRLDEGAHEAYVVPEGYRGIQETVVGPGRYYVNTLAVSSDHYSHNEPNCGMDRRRSGQHFQSV